MRKSVSALIVLFCLFICAFSQAQPLQKNVVISEIKSELKHDYAVKIVTGEQKDKHNEELGRGMYSSLVNIYNPNPESVIILKKLVLTNPSQDDGTSTTIPIGNEVLMSNHAIKVNPLDYVDSLSNNNYFEGFLAIHSTGALDISTVYSASKFNSNKIVAFDIENNTNINEEDECPQTAKLPDLIPVPFMDGKYLHFFYGDLQHPAPFGNNHFMMMVRNTGSKSCGPFEVKLYKYGISAPVPMGTGWLSGLDIDEEKVLTIFLTDGPSNGSYRIDVDIKNLIEELSEDNNVVDSGLTSITW